MEEPGGWKRAAIIYCGLTFVVSWSLWIGAAWSGGAILNISLLFLHLEFSQKSALIMVGNFVPGFIAVVVGALSEEVPFRTFLARLRPPKSPMLLYAFAILAPITINLAMFIAQEKLSPNALANLHLSHFVRLFLVNVLLGPLWEEIGWRGFLLPILSKHIGLGRASLLVGLVWGSWHFVLYQFVLQIPVTSFLISFSVIVAMAVVLAVLYSAGGNALLLPILFHTSWNASVNWVIMAEPKYDLGPIVLQAVAVWTLAGVAWIYYRRWTTIACLPLVRP